MSFDKNYLRELARIIDSKLPDNHGFILLTFPFGDDPGSRVTYTSNGKRQQCIAAMKEFIITVGGEEEWMKHIK
jgi:hypothetical protein